MAQNLVKFIPYSRLATLHKGTEVWKTYKVPGEQCHGQADNGHPGGIRRQHATTFSYIQKE